MGLQFERNSDGNGVVSIFLRGTIDETADLESVFRDLRGPVVFNLRGIERINSIGISRWITLIGGFSRKNRTSIDELSYAVVVQANNIANMFGGAEVRSCMAPYYCARCDASRTVLVKGDEIMRAGKSVPKKICNTCGSPMDFDELDTYFTFFHQRERSA
jgi:hypothetical protein